jgi:ChrR-like protein with cupin domain
MSTKQSPDGVGDGVGLEAGGDMPDLLDALASDDAAALSALGDDAHAAALALPPVPPPPSLRDRLLASVAGASRFADLVAPVARLYGLDDAAAAAMLDRLDEDQAWSPGLIPGTRCIAMRPAAATGATVGFLLRVPAGFDFPVHEHVGGAEHGLVLQGSCIDGDGMIYRRGESFENAGGSVHGFSVPSDEPDFIVALRLDGGVRFPGFDGASAG